MVYLDTSFIAPLLIAEDTSDAVESYLLRLGDDLATSDWTRVEFASLLSRRVRMKELDRDQADNIRKAFDRILLDSFHTLTPSQADFGIAVQLLQEPSTGLRAGDARHLGVIHNHGWPELLSLDQGMVNAAHLLGFQARTGIPLNR